MSRNFPSLFSYLGRGPFLDEREGRDDFWKEANSSIHESLSGLLVIGDWEEKRKSMPSLNGLGLEICDQECRDEG